MFEDFAPLRSVFESESLPCTQKTLFRRLYNVHTTFGWRSWNVKITLRAYLEVYSLSLNHVSCNMSCLNSTDGCKSSSELGWEMRNDKPDFLWLWSYLINERTYQMENQLEQLQPRIRHFLRSAEAELKLTDCFL